VSDAAEADERVLAIDFGDVRTGIAISDPTGTLARPLEPVARATTSDGMATIARLVATHGVHRVIVGLPTGLRGETTLTAQTRSFAGRLRTQVSVPVELYDERFTSRLADQTSAATGTDTTRDSLAACHLLTSWLGARSR
jgi:putative Holliday junction resolvase